MPRRPAHWLLWSALVIHAPIALVCAARSSQPIYDFERYYDIATNPGRPYLDFPVEYPPGTVLTLRALATAAGSRARFGVGLVLISVVADAIIVAALGWGWGVGAGLVGAAIVGSAIAASDGYYYDGYRRCGWVRQFDAYGNVIGRVRTCNDY